MAREQLTGRDWLAFSLAAAIPGFTLAIALAGVFQFVGDARAADKSQVAMWLVPALWAAAAGTAFGFRRPRAAWAWLTAANLVAAAGVLLLRAG